MDAGPEVVPLQAVELVKRWEGLAKLMNDGMVYPYLDIVGLPTQGYGIRVESLAVPPITPDEAVRRCVTHLWGLSKGIAPLVHPSLYDAPNKLSGVLSWVYNLGVGAFARSTFRVRLAEANWLAAARECRRWVYAGPPGAKVKVRGLVLRREMEAQLIER